MNRIIGMDLARGPDKTGVLIRPGRQAGKTVALKDQVKEWLATGVTVVMGNGREMNRVVGVVDDPNTRLIEAKTMRDPKYASRGLTPPEVTGYHALMAQVLPLAQDIAAPRAQADSLAGRATAIHAELRSEPSPLDSPVLKRRIVHGPRFAWTEPASRRLSGQDPNRTFRRIRSWPKWESDHYAKQQIAVGRTC